MPYAHAGEFLNLESPLLVFDYLGLDSGPSFRLLIDQFVIRTELRLIYRFPDDVNLLEFMLARILA